MNVNRYFLDCTGYIYRYNNPIINTTSVQYNNSTHPVPYCPSVPTWPSSCLQSRPCPYVVQSYTPVPSIHGPGSRTGTLTPGLSLKKHSPPGTSWSGFVSPSPLLPTGPTSKPHR